MKLFMRICFRATLLTATIGLFGCDSKIETTESNESLDMAEVSTNAADVITVNTPWIRSTAPGQTVSGAFMTLVNDSPMAHALSTVSFNGARAVEIHETSMVDGVMRMRQVEQIDIPANGSAELKPGSFHIMLMGLERGMKAGTTESLTLTFSDGSEKTIEASVGTPNE